MHPLLLDLDGSFGSHNSGSSVCLESGDFSGEFGRILIVNASVADGQFMEGLLLEG
jgi:hypothetical protein